MKILVYPHALHIGGSQIIAIELAAAVRDRGHQVLIAAPDGALAELVAQRGLRLALLPSPPGRRPSLGAISFVRRIVREEAIDVVHAYERVACLEAYFGAHVLGRVPMVGTMMGMSRPRPFPKSIPFIVGTMSLEESVRGSRRGHVHLMEPPIDTDENSPGVSALAFKDEHGLDDTHRHVVIVSRLANLVKREGLERSIDVMALLAEQLPVRLIIVGGGEAYEPLSRRAKEANERLGRRAIIFTGPMLDPRPAYAAADLVIGMGSSVLRGMAFAKPAVVVGERGFSEVVTPATVDRFLHAGFYGVGDGDMSPQRLCHQIQHLLQDEGRRAELGRYSRQLVCERFSLRAAAERLDQLYQDSVEGNPRRRASFAESLSIGAWVLGSHAKQRALRSRRSVPSRMAY